MKQIRVGVLAGSLLLAASVSAVAGGASVAAPPGADHAATARAAPVGRVAMKRGAVLKPSVDQVTEGERYTLTARVKSPLQAVKVMLQKYVPPLYEGAGSSWGAVKTVKVRGKAKAKFKAVATDENTERFRAVVTYKTGKPAESKPAGVTVWRWIPLSEYAPYYETGGAIFGTTTINGQAYTGWGAATYSHVGTWESRFTPGRHCTQFRGVIGLGDISKDGSSGNINFTADDALIYQSPALTPGMSVPVTIPLAQPYRFGIQLSDTTLGGTTGRDTTEAWPVIGDPALLCTGV